MATVLPQSREQMIAWFAARIASWAANPTAINLTMAQVTELATLLNDAQAALAAATAARIASKDATLLYHYHADLLRAYGGDMITLIKAGAEINNDPSIYAQASVPPPAEPSPLGPPPMPTELSSHLNTAGQVVLTWKCPRSGGTSFSIARRTTAPAQPVSGWTLIGTSEEQRFIDTALPVGLESATYRVVASRVGGSSEPSDVSTLFFGTGNQQATEEGEGGLTLAA